MPEMYADLCKCYVHKAVDEMENWCVYIRYCVHAEFERQNQGY